MRTVKIVVDYSDGHFRYREATEKDTIFSTVSRQQIREWEYVSRLYNDVQRELCYLDNMTQEKEEKGKEGEATK